MKQTATIGLFTVLITALFVASSSFASITETVSENKDNTLQRVIEVNVDKVNMTKSEIVAPQISGFSNRKVIDLALKGVESASANLHVVGKPALPVVRMFVTGNVSVVVDQKQSDDVVPASSVIRPALASVIKRPGAKVVVKFDRAAYKSDSFYPSAPYRIDAAGSINGVPQKLITLYPVAIQASTGKYIVRPHFTIRANQQNLKVTPAQPLVAFVVGAKFAKNQALAEYLKLKEQQGFSTVMGVMGKDFNTDIEIRAFLNSKLKNNLKYAVIVGDIEDVPSHKSNIITGFTDHFYRAIDTNSYDTDINGPDIGLGRLSVANEKQLNDVIAKLTRYQNGTFQSNAWLKNAAFLATDDRYEVAEKTHNYAIDTYTSKTGYRGTFPNASEAKGGDKLYAITNKANTNDVVKALNEGRAIVNYSGHGGPQEWAGPAFSESNVRDLTNKDALPFVISNACDTADISVYESFGETWLRHPAGAIAFWGSFDSTYWDEDDILERKMYDGIFKNKLLELGAVTNNALSGVWQQYGGEQKSAYYWETYFLLGDPSIKLRLE